MNKFFIYFLLLSVQLTHLTESIKGQSVKSNIYVEETYLITDRDIYIAGETLFFNLYVINGATKMPQVKSKYAYIVLRNEQNVKISGNCLKLENGAVSGSIYLHDTLNTGIYQLVVYTNYMRNKDEELFFKKEIVIANRFDEDLDKLNDLRETHIKISQEVTNALSEANNQILQIKLEKEQYSKREKVRFSLEAIGTQSTSLTYLSVSVREVSPISDQEILMNDYLLNSTVVRPDNNANTANCAYLLESKDMILQGKVKDSESQKGIANAIVFLSTPDTFANLQFAKTDASGVFRFLVNNYYSNKNLIIRCVNIQTANIQLDDKFLLNRPFKPSKHFVMSDLKEYLLKCQNMVEIQKNYQIQLNNELVSAKADYGTPLSIYPPTLTSVYPADFVALNDFVEISRELLPLLKIREQHHEYVANMMNESKQLFFENSPIIFLDGVPIDNINQIIKLGSDKINRIETIGAERYYGELYFSGILAVFSKTMEIKNITWTMPTLSINLESAKTFSMPLSPDYTKFDTNVKYIPDFRQLLYWEPNFTLKGNEKKYIEFFASDNTGVFEIKAGGISSTGVFISAKARISVLGGSKNKP